MPQSGSFYGEILGVWLEQSRSFLWGSLEVCLGQCRSVYGTFAELYWVVWECVCVSLGVCVGNFGSYGR